ncbi:YiaA/YiaB family inner membrane protein [Aneurinibacillus tyrosinisolvens]|uniref:YiaA/YiaB family inner membrane protein n=1 Tax=Aneurinibacillus tyrosinisolvens TaxID=1443435 RepID=UPI00063F8817|nr:YiaA/YiaB family inner membrane protein [Aneurinibacillus tyrosinisolvens]
MKRRRNTPAFTFLAWACFAIAFIAMYGGLYTLNASFPVKGYYAITSLFLIFTSFTLQKVLRDNAEDDEMLREDEKYSHERVQKDKGV